MANNQNLCLIHKTMDKLDKPTSLRDNNKRSDTLASDSPSIVYENAQLKETLKELLDSATHNQQTQERFYELELYFLESESYDCLLKRILNDLKLKLRLAQVELVLLDPDHETRQLISEIYGELDYANLQYVDKLTAIKNYYQNHICLNLTQQQEQIKNLFKGAQTISKSVAQIPLTRANKIIGSLHLGSRDLNRFHSGLATNFLQHMGSIISVCIENSINQERYIHLSLVDMLTRAKNRRYFFQALAREIARASRSLKPLSCLFIDLDHFKRINDVHGHLIGDRALRQVSKSILPLLRKSDILARFGGEEFTVLLPDCDSIQAVEIAQRIRKQVAALQITNADADAFQITISIGVSHWNPQTQKYADAEAVQNYLINTADQGVYQAKQNGRNRVKYLDSSN